MYLYAMKKDEQGGVRIAEASRLEYTSILVKALGSGRARLKGGPHLNSHNKSGSGGGI